MHSPSPDKHSPPSPRHSGHLTLTLAASFGGGLDGLGALVYNRLHDAAWWKDGRGAPMTTSRLRGCSRNGSSRFLLEHEVFDRLSLLLCCRKLQGIALDNVAEEASLRQRSIQELCLLLLLNVSETQPEMVLLDHKHGHRTTQRLRGHLRRSECEVC